MRKSLRCPKCQAEKILAVDSVLDRDGVQRPLSLGEDSKLLGFSSDVIGKLSCCVCAACGYAEWFVDNASKLPIDGKRIRILSEKVETPPFR